MHSPRLGHASLPGGSVRRASVNAGQKDASGDDSRGCFLCVIDPGGDLVSVSHNRSSDDKVIDLRCHGGADGESACDDSGAIAIHGISAGLRAHRSSCASG